MHYLSEVLQRFSEVRYLRIFLGYAPRQHNIRMRRKPHSIGRKTVYFVRCNIQYLHNSVMIRFRLQLHEIPTAIFSEYELSVLFCVGRLAILVHLYNAEDS